MATKWTFYPAMNSLDDGLLTVTFTLADSNKAMITNVRLSNKSKLILSKKNPNFIIITYDKPIFFTKNRTITYLLFDIAKCFHA